MPAKSPREALFISHANPEDNDFVRWLGAKLTAMGYEVWADVMRLHGGIDWARALEDALRNKALKVLLVCTPLGLDKQGVRNEIEIAAGLATRLADSAFIIPLRLQRFDAPFRIAHAQYIDFMSSWASGLAELSELLENQNIPRRNGAPIRSWLSVQALGAATLEEKPEPLISNWLELATMPSHIHFMVPPTGFPIERFQDRTLQRWPVVPHNAGVFTFAPPIKDGHLSDGIPGVIARSIESDAFLSFGVADLGVSAEQCRRIFVDLATQGFDRLCARRGLRAVASANGHSSWWPDIKLAPLTQVRFDWNIRRGARQIIGHSDKRRIHWHYAIAGQFRLGPVRHLRLSPRLVFSENGLDAITDARKSHALRRSFAKGWRNPRWRDMLCAFIWWLSEHPRQLRVHVSEADAFTFDLPPMQFGCPVSVRDADDLNADDDSEDPDVEMSVEDEAFGEEGSA